MVIYSGGLLDENGYDIFNFTCSWTVEFEVYHYKFCVQSLENYCPEMIYVKCTFDPSLLHTTASKIVLRNTFVKRGPE